MTVGPCPSKSTWGRQRRPAAAVSARGPASERWGVGWEEPSRWCGSLNHPRGFSFLSLMVTDRAGLGHISHLPALDRWIITVSHVGPLWWSLTRENEALHTLRTEFQAREQTCESSSPVLNSIFLSLRVLTTEWREWFLLFFIFLGSPIKPQLTGRHTFSVICKTLKERGNNQDPDHFRI